MNFKEQKQRMYRFLDESNMEGIERDYILVCGEIARNKKRLKKTKNTLMNRLFLVITPFDSQPDAYIRWEDVAYFKKMQELKKLLQDLSRKKQQIRTKIRSKYAW
jgi:hypothetical protein